MIWTEDGPDATALSATFERALDDGVVVAAATVSSDGTASAITKGDVGPSDRFEIGSITKPLTATLAAVLVGEGKLNLSDEIGPWLDAGPNGSITVEQLATHTSGLPRLAPNALSESVDMSNPYARFTAELAEEGLRSAELSPERTVSYSNFGFQLLGLVLERASGESFDELLSTRLTGPLGLDHTGVRGADIPGNRVTGHAGGREVPHWDQVLPGPGGIESSITDMAKLARALLFPSDSALGRAMRLAQEPRVDARNGRRQGLGWVIEADGLVWHNGGTGGFSSEVFLDRDAGRAVVLLANTSGIGDDLHRAGALAIRGGDPLAARPTPLGQEWAERASRLAEDLLAGEFAKVHAELGEGLRSRLTPETLGGAWEEYSAGSGTRRDIEVLPPKRSGAGVVSELQVHAENRVLRVAVGWDAEARIAGLKLLDEDEAFPF